MAANLWGRYVWLVDTLLHYEKLTYEEINRLWKRSGLSYGESDELPLHPSQKEIARNDEEEYAIFEYHVKPTFDFYQLLLAQGDQIAVLKPASVRNKMREFARNLMDYYER